MRPWMEETAIAASKKVSLYFVKGRIKIGMK
jgi:hypothetical protein